MGNCLRIPFLCEKVRSSTVKGLKYLRNGDESFTKEYDVILIDDSEEEIEIRDAGHQFGSSDSTVVTNRNEKVDDVVKMIEVMHDFIGSSDNEVEYNEKSLQYQKKEIQNKRNAVQECFVPLTQAEQVIVVDGLSLLNNGKVLVRHDKSNIHITGETLQCLRAGAWLNDEVVNLYFELLKEREQREPKKFLKCHFFNTFFFKKISSSTLPITSALPNTRMKSCCGWFELSSGNDGYNYQAVRRWTMQRKLGYSLSDCEKIFVPIHKAVHWSLGIINKKDRKFQYVDSFRGVDHEVIDVLSKYYVDEVKDKSGEDIDVSSWKEEFVRSLPQQENVYDCGMFMIKYADFYSRDVEPCFDQSDMPYFRQRTTKEILVLEAQ